MMTSLAMQLVADFWERVGYQESFPRTLERAIMSTMPAFVVKVHRRRLDTHYVRDWLRDRDVALPAPWKPRRLNGCLVAYRGEAAIFLDGTLPCDDARVMIAHEFGHFLAEYHGPRLRAVRRLGDSVVEILDGDRAPAPPRSRRRDSGQRAAWRLRPLYGSSRRLGHGRSGEQGRKHRRHRGGGTAGPAGHGLAELGEDAELNHESVTCRALCTIRITPALTPTGTHHAWFNG